MTALSLARLQFHADDNLFRAGVRIRIAKILRQHPRLDDDSVFIMAVADERRGEPLP